MKTYVITIKPISGFGTPLKGDTIFGHICWQAAYDEKLFGISIDKLIADYAANPFMIISSAYPKLDKGYALKRPDMPIDILFDFSTQSKADAIKNRKELKGKRWMIVSDNRRLTDLKSEGLYLSDEELFEKLSVSKDDETQRQLRKKGVKSFIADYTQPHNTINRLTGTTGEGQFAPYSVDQKVFIKEAELAIFVGIRVDITIDSFIKALKQIGATGFGKDASTGLGRFEVSGHKEIDLRSIGADSPNACYTLAPCVPEKDAFGKMFFTPFTRFGRHGDVLAKSGKPFKNPVIMADEGAVFIVNGADVFKKPYIGTAVSGISKIELNAVTQGYSLYIPVNVEAYNE
jgi:CRISPR-associated protein Csm4